MSGKLGPWTCDICHKPIRGATGYVTISDRRGGYPQGNGDKQPRKPPLPGIHSVAERIANGEFDIPPLSVKFAVMHAACDPNPDGSEYWFGVERACTLEKYLHWALHLGDKVWMGKRETLAFIAFWFDNRGIYRDELG